MDDRFKQIRDILIYILALNWLVDRAVLYQKKIEELACSFPQVKMCHKVRTRGREDDIHL